jgi:hypothetical protein
MKTGLPCSRAALMSRKAEYVASVVPSTRREDAASTSSNLVSAQQIRNSSRVIAHCWRQRLPEENDIGLDLW